MNDTLEKLKGLVDGNMYWLPVLEKIADAWDAEREPYAIYNDSDIEYGCLVVDNRSSQVVATYKGRNHSLAVEYCNEKNAAWRKDNPVKRYVPAKRYHYGESPNYDAIDTELEMIKQSCFPTYETALGYCERMNAAHEREVKLAEKPKWVVASGDKVFDILRCGCVGEATVPAGTGQMWCDKWNSINEAEDNDN